METSLRLIRQMQEMGYRRLVATPHIYKELYPNSPDTILPALVQVQSALKEADMEIPIQAAAEYFLDEHFEHLLAKDEILTLPDRHVLIEMSFMAPYPKLHEIVFQLCTKGYRPILAHPERYLYYADDLEQYEQIRQYGCKLQLNLLSLSGYYGKPSQRLAQQMLGQGWVSFLGTDLHHDRHASHLQQMLKDSRLMRQLEQTEFENKTWSIQHAPD